MSHQPDDRQPDDQGSASETERQKRYDEDALWADIVANYGERPAMGAEPGERAAAADPDRPRDLFDRSFIDATTEPARELNTPASWDDEGHFVPPVPPPLPTVEPRRKAAWIGLFGAPTLMLVGIVLGWVFPSWVSAVLVAAFVGGFVYLVATMPRGRGGGWSGDDGAVV